MKKNDTFSYDVSVGEKITIKVTAINFGDSIFSVQAILDGNPITRLPGTVNAPIYEFAVTKPVGTSHVVVLEFMFGTPANALYDVTISGENDQGCPCGFSVTKDDADLSRYIKFFVADTHGGGGGSKD